MGPTLFFLKRRSTSPEVQQTKMTLKLSGLDTRRMPLLIAENLIPTVGLENTIRSIKRLVSVSDKHWNVLYKPAIDTYIELCQLAPASVAHHHAGPGGLIAHTLESVDMALRLRKPLVLPRNADPDTTAHQEHIWTYAVFCAVLLHDNGKLATTTRLRLEDGRLWSPLAGSPIRSGCKHYSIEFVTAPYKLHARVANAGLRILPESGIAWLSQFPEIMSQVIAYLYGDLYESGVVGELAHTADGQSVAANLKIGGDRIRYANAPSIPLVDHLIIGLRSLLSNNELKVNANGADGWITDQHAYMVCGTVANKLLEHLRKQGVTNVPSDNNRIFDILQEHGFVISTVDGKAIHHTKIIGPKRTYEFNLTMLKFETSRLFPPSKRPQCFVGEIIEYHDGKPVRIPTVQNAAQQSNVQVVTSPTQNTASVATTNQPKTQSSGQTLVQNQHIQNTASATVSVSSEAYENHSHDDATKAITSNEAGNQQDKIGSGVSSDATDILQAAATTSMNQPTACASTASRISGHESNNASSHFNRQLPEIDEDDPYALTPISVDDHQDNGHETQHCNINEPSSSQTHADGANNLGSITDATALDISTSVDIAASDRTESNASANIPAAKANELEKKSRENTIVWHDVTPSYSAEAPLTPSPELNIGSPNKAISSQSNTNDKEHRAITFDDIRPVHIDDDIGPKFMDWLARMLRNGKLPVNRRDALIHIVPEGMLAVSPRIFKEFCAFYDLNAKSDGTQLTSDEAGKHVQKRVEKLRKNIKTGTGMSVHVYVITGKNKTSSVNGFLFDPLAFYGHLSPPGPNPLLVKATL